mmetsp:Transcript_8128/g.17815  ORF Transcript_8128/g.17815 Transcript_8128/m.17815 type:complete len:262 (-) Transcript_8128:244-1029(-)
MSQRDDNPSSATAAAAADSKRHKRPIIVGIAGGTGSGKTTIAAKICKVFGGGEWREESNCSDDESKIVHLSHDDYYKDLSHLPLDTRAKTNFDHPSSLETSLLISHLRDLLEGKSITVPRYDFKRHCRWKEGEVDDLGRSRGRVICMNDEKRIILVEGILILSVKELADMMDLKVFVDATADIRLLRRIQRDTTERGRTIPEIMTQYSNTVRPMHNEFVEPSKRHADLVVHGHDEDEEIGWKRMDLAVRVICNHLTIEIER